MTARLNDFTQVFKDLMIFIRREEGTYKGGTSLRYCMASFETFNFNEDILNKAVHLYLELALHI